MADDSHDVSFLAFPYLAFLSGRRLQVRHAVNGTCGCLAALAAKQVRGKWPPWLYWLLLLSGSAINIVCYLMAHEFVYATSIIAFGAALIVLGSTGVSARFFVILTPLAALGRRSYEVYLTHMPLLLLLLPIMSSAPNAWQPLVFASYLLVLFLVGEILGAWFSDPANRAIRMAVAER